MTAQREKTLSELIETRRKLESELHIYNNLIQSHPEYLQKVYFNMLRDTDTLAKELVSKVTNVTETSGSTASRKNEMTYEGWYFTFDGVEYLLTYGSNWCYSFDNLRKASDGYEEDDDDNFSFIEDFDNETIEGIEEVHVIASILRVTSI